MLKRQSPSSRRRWWRRRTRRPSAGRTTASSPSELEKDKTAPPAKREFTPEEWRQAPGAGDFAAVSSELLHQPARAGVGVGAAPVAEGQVESIWDTARYGKTSEGLAKDPNPSYVYRARLAYPEQVLAPGATAIYRLLAFGGPKDHDMLAGLKYDATSALKLSSACAPIVLVKGLVWYLRQLHGVLGSWGWSIVVLTDQRPPAALPAEPVADQEQRGDAEAEAGDGRAQREVQGRRGPAGLAIQELWRKNGVSNPVVGCVPMLLQMPVWLALYSALQTLVELYHVPFGPAPGSSRTWSRPASTSSSRSCSGPRASCSRRSCRRRATRRSRR